LNGPIKEELEALFSFACPSGIPLPSSVPTFSQINQSNSPSLGQAAAKEAKMNNPAQLQVQAQSQTQRVSSSELRISEDMLKLALV